MKVRVTEVEQAVVVGVVSLLCLKFIDREDAVAGGQLRRLQSIRAIHNQIDLKLDRKSTV